MVFTSPVFLGLFLPVLLAVYFLANHSARSYVLLLFSLLFYAWGEPHAVVVMIALMVVNYAIGLGIAACGTTQDPKTYERFAGDLRMVLLCFQSFNTGRLDERREEISAIFTALKAAISQAKRP